MQRKWFSIFLVVVASLAIVAQPAAAVSSTVVISEFRTRGPNGANDQFIELYNLSGSAVDITGYFIYAWDATFGTELVSEIVHSDGESPVMLQPYGHYLIANSAGYLSPPLPAPDDTLFFPLRSNAVGIALIAPNGTTVVDAVSTTDAAPAQYKEGAVLTPLGSNSNQSYARLPDSLSVAGGHKNGVDFDTNSADFILVTSSPEPWSGGAGPTAITLQDFSAQAQPAAAWMWPLALVVVLGGALIVSRRRA